MFFSVAVRQPALALCLIRLDLTTWSAVSQSAWESLVPLGVQSEVVGAGERARAVQTAERFRSGMLANVSRQLVGTCKVPLAAREVTTIRLLAYTTHTRGNSVTTTFFGCDAANTNLTFLLHAFLFITCQHAIHTGVASYGAPEHLPPGPVDFQQFISATSRWGYAKYDIISYAK